ncbi:unnamed protein product, partial [Prorocentrum cordatum]
PACQCRGASRARGHADLRAPLGAGRPRGRVALGGRRRPRRWQRPPGRAGGGALGRVAGGRPGARPRRPGGRRALASEQAGAAQPVHGLPGRRRGGSGRGRAGAAPRRRPRAGVRLRAALRAAGRSGREGVGHLESGGPRRRERDRRQQQHVLGVRLRPRGRPARQAGPQARWAEEHHGGQDRLGVPGAGVRRAGPGRRCRHHGLRRPGRLLPGRGGDEAGGRPARGGRRRRHAEDHHVEAAPALEPRGRPPPLRHPGRGAAHGRPRRGQGLPRPRGQPRRLAEVRRPRRAARGLQVGAVLSGPQAQDSGPMDGPRRSEAGAVPSRPRRWASCKSLHGNAVPSSLSRREKGCQSQVYQEPRFAGYCEAQVVQYGHPTFLSGCATLAAHMAP